MAATIMDLRNLTPLAGGAGYILNAANQAYSQELDGGASAADAYSVATEAATQTADHLYQGAKSFP